jgi:hypothetical protein
VLFGGFRYASKHALVKANEFPAIYHALKSDASKNGSVSALLAPGSPAGRFIHDSVQQ